MTTAEVCRLLKITRPTLYHWIEKGKLAPWKKLGDGSTFLFLRNLLTRKPLQKYSRNRPQNTAWPQWRGPAKDMWKGTYRRGAAENQGYRTTARVFLVSQDKIIQDRTCSDLQNQGYYVSVAGDFSNIAAVLKAGEIPEILILDLDFNSEFLSGWKLFAEIKRLVKESNHPPPVYLLLSGKHTAPQDAVKALKKGAWDFLKKPMASSVFTARVRLALRRRFWSELDASPGGSILTSRDGRIALDPDNRILEIRGSFKQPVFRHLTHKEAELLCLFLKRPGMLFSKATLLEVVWGYTANIRTRTVDCHIKNLRQKLNPHSRRIETRYSLGYRFIATPCRPPFFQPITAEKMVK